MAVVSHGVAPCRGMCCEIREIARGNGLKSSWEALSGRKHGCEELLQEASPVSGSFWAARRPRRDGAVVDPPHAGVASVASVGPPSRLCATALRHDTVHLVQPCTLPFEVLLGQPLAASPHRPQRARPTRHPFPATEAARFEPGTALCRRAGQSMHPSPGPAPSPDRRARAAAPSRWPVTCGASRSCARCSEAGLPTRNLTPGLGPNQALPPPLGGTRCGGACDGSFPLKTGSVAHDVC